MRLPARTSVAVLAVSTCLAALATSGHAAAARPSAAPAWNAPVLLTTDKYAGGYEPTVVVDRFNNVVVTAHKQNATLVLSPDSRSATKVRSQSWLWTSKDGQTFTDLPGLTPAQEQNGEFGDEGDLAYDDAGAIYFVDTNVVDDSFSRYRATGNGQLKLETTRPIGPFGEPVDDRPWIAAHGNGVVLYTGNEGNKTTYPAGRKGDGDAYGPGRYTGYMSYDSGASFDPLGVTFNDSGWCRPAADHRPGSKDLYVLCTNDGDATGTAATGNPPKTVGTLYAFASHDDGRTWTRSRMGKYDATDRVATYPSVAIGPDGTIYALYSENKTDANGAPTGGRLRLLRSSTRGRTWTETNVTPFPGIYRYTWLDVAPDGAIGIAFYHRPTTDSDWYVWAGTAKAGQKLAYSKVSAAPIASKANTSAFGDFFQAAFGPDSKLSVVYTSENKDLLLEGLNTDIYYAKQR